MCAPWVFLGKPCCLDKTRVHLLLSVWAAADPLNAHACMGACSRKLGMGLDSGGSGGMPPNSGLRLLRPSTVVQVCGESSSPGRGGSGELTSVRNHHVRHRVLCSSHTYTCWQHTCRVSPRPRAKVHACSYQSTHTSALSFLHHARMRLLVACTCEKYHVGLKNARS
jgi:hypothetical protein